MVFQWARIENESKAQNLPFAENAALGERKIRFLPIPKKNF
jgi:hypothetical protein